MFEGSITALVTPFLKDSSIDFDAFRRLIEEQISAKTDALVIGGSTGEGSLLSFEELSALFKCAVETAKKRILLIGSTGCQTTSVAFKKTQVAKSLGMDGSIIIIPYHIRPTEEGCYAHFSSLSKIKIPMILYHHPGRTGVRLSAKGLANICTIPEIVGIKEASGDLTYAVEVRQLTNKIMLSGDDSMALGHLACGFKGTISIVSNAIPRIWKTFTDAACSGEINQARKIFEEIYPFVRSLVIETNPQGIKYAMSVLRKCEPYLREPLMLPREETRKEIEKAINALPIAELILR